MGDAHVKRLPNQSANRAATPFPAVEPLNKIKLTVALAQLPAAVLTPDFGCNFGCDPHASIEGSPFTPASEVSKGIDGSQLMRVP